MRCVIQRVSRAEVRVAGAATGQVANGLLVLAAFAADDDEATLRWMAAKLPSLRIFGDDAGRLNRSLRDLGGGVLLVSQFTLYGDCRRGQRPEFHPRPPRRSRRAGCTSGSPPCCGRRGSRWRRGCSAR